MANIDNPNGLLYRGRRDGSMSPTVTRQASAEIFIGDPCTEGVNGQVTRIANGAVDSTDAIKFVAVSHAAANADVHLIDIRSGEETFEVQADDATITANVEGQVYDLVQAAGDATTLYSGCELDGDTGGGANSIVEVVKMIDRPDVDLTANTRVLVKFLSSVADAQ